MEIPILPIYQERRRCSRLPKNGLPIVISNMAKNEFSAKLNDISEQGISIDINFGDMEFKGYMVNKSFFCILPSRQHNEEQLKIMCKPIWHKIISNPAGAICRIGAKFVNVSDNQCKSISSLVYGEYFQKIPASVCDNLPSYIFYDHAIRETWLDKILGEIILLGAHFWVRKQRKIIDDANCLTKDTTQRLYDTIAKNYLREHATTTYRLDDVWRLWVSQMLVQKIEDANRLQKRTANHLELFAGTGLSYAAQAKVFSLYDLNVHSVLLDYSGGMLEVAKNTTLPNVEKKGYAYFVPNQLSIRNEDMHSRQYRRTYEVIHCDVTDLTGEQNNHRRNECYGTVPRNYFDAASVMCGIGALSLMMSLQVSEELLKVLRENAKFAMTDIHKPLIELAGRWNWPFPLEFRWPWLEREIFKRINIGYMLHHLWGWYDLTLYPHLMKLCTINDGGIWYGWQTHSFEVQSHLWEFGMPILPVFRQVLTKVAISQEEAEKRKEVLKFVVSKLKRGGSETMFVL